MNRATPRPILLLIARFREDSRRVKILGKKISSLEIRRMTTSSGKTLEHFSRRQFFSFLFERGGEREEEIRRRRNVRCDQSMSTISNRINETYIFLPRPIVERPNLTMAFEIKSLMCCGRAKWQLEGQSLPYSLSLSLSLTLTLSLHKIAELTDSTQLPLWFVYIYIYYICIYIYVNAATKGRRYFPSSLIIYARLIRTKKSALIKYIYIYIHRRVQYVYVYVCRVFTCTYIRIYLCTEREYLWQRMRPVKRRRYLSTFIAAFLREIGLLEKHDRIRFHAFRRASFFHRWEGSVCCCNKQMRARQ